MTEVTVRVLPDVEGNDGGRRLSCLCPRRKPQENGLDVVADGLYLALDAVKPVVYQVEPLVDDLQVSVDLAVELFNPPFQPIELGSDLDVDRPRVARAAAASGLSLNGWIMQALEKIVPPSRIRAGCRYTTARGSMTAWPFLFCH